MTAKINLSRDSGWLDYMVKYCVIINGDIIAKICNGEQKTFSVEPGIIEIQLCYYRFWCSNKIQYSIHENERLNLKCKCNLRGWKIFVALFYAIFFPHKWIVLEQVK